MPESREAEAEKPEELLCSLVRELREVLAVVSRSEHWWMSVPDRGGFDTERIALLIAKAEALEPEAPVEAHAQVEQ